MSPGTNQPQGPGAGTGGAGPGEGWGQWLCPVPEKGCCCLPGHWKLIQSWGVGTLKYGCTCMNEPQASALSYQHDSPGGQVCPQQEGVPAGMGAAGRVDHCRLQGCLPTFPLLDLHFVRPAGSRTRSPALLVPASCPRNNPQKSPAGETPITTGPVHLALWEAGILAGRPRGVFACCPPSSATCSQGSGGSGEQLRPRVPHTCHLRASCPPPHPQGSVPAGGIIKHFVTRE